MHQRRAKEPISGSILPAAAMATINGSPARSIWPIGLRPSSLHPTGQAVTAAFVFSVIVACAGGALGCEG